MVSSGKYYRSHLDWTGRCKGSISSNGDWFVMLRNSEANLSQMCCQIKYWLSETWLLGFITMVRLGKHYWSFIDGECLLEMVYFDWWTLICDVAKLKCDEIHRVLSQYSLFGLSYLLCLERIVLVSCRYIHPSFLNGMVEFKRVYLERLATIFDAMTLPASESSLYDTAGVLEAKIKPKLRLTWQPSPIIVFKGSGRIRLGSWTAKAISPESDDTTSHVTKCSRAGTVSFVVVSLF